MDGLRLGGDVFVRRRIDLIDQLSSVYAAHIAYVVQTLHSRWYIAIPRRNNRRRDDENRRWQKPLEPVGEPEILQSAWRRERIRSAPSYISVRA